MFTFDMPDAGQIRQARRAGKLIVSEAAPPIEQIEYPSLRPDGVFDTAAYQRLVDAYHLQLSASDLFIARSDIGRVTLAATLCAAGLIRFESDR
ncbi:hypothetical protein [Nocardia miyunensis]|uniref:hypothetical protein n=1 Tax=Nocardia miyunensis TaxID=282684 RepID=UPI001FE0052D|nr:hypothetical protein [Nocardia miyunensis]